MKSFDHDCAAYDSRHSNILKTKIIITKIDTNYEVTFGDELTSNMSPFFKFSR